MPGAASPEEAVFTGADDPTASPVAQEFIKKLQAQGLPANATNMRRLIEANARNISEDPSTTGPDPVPTVRNDRVENSARPAARRGRVVDSGLMEPQGPLPTPPIPPGQEGAVAAKAPVPVVDPESGQVVSPEGGDFNANIGALIAGAIPALYGVSRIPGINRMFPGGATPPPLNVPPGNTMTVTPPGAPTTSAAPAAPPAPPPPTAPVAGAQPNISGTSNVGTPVRPPTAAPPPPPAPPVVSEGGSVTLRPGAPPPPPGIRLPSGSPPVPPPPVAPPVAEPPAPKLPTAPSRAGLARVMAGNKAGVGRMGAGIPFVIPEGGDTAEERAKNTVDRWLRPKSRK